MTAPMLFFGLGRFTMPLRTTSLNKRLQKNGIRLHAAMLSRIRIRGSDEPPSELEQSLLTERHALKKSEAKRQEQAKLPRPKAVKPVKQAKPPREPKPPKAKEPKTAVRAKGHMTRAEKLAKKAENLEAAKKAAKKSAET